MAEPAEDCVKIPLRGKDGAIRGWALVDSADLAALSPYAWHLGNNGYAMRKAGPYGQQKAYMMHREILGLAQGDRTRQCDHINRDRLDNRRENLRSVTHQQNSQNQKSRGGTSRFRNVFWERRYSKWQARVKLNGKHRYVGHFDDEVEAARAAQAFREEHMPYAQPDPELAKLEEVASAA